MSDLTPEYAIPHGMTGHVIQHISQPDQRAPCAYTRKDKAIRERSLPVAAILLSSPGQQKNTDQ